MPFNIEKVGKILAKIEKGKFNNKIVSITDEDSDEITKNFSNIHIPDDGKFQQIPDPETERQILYIFGPSGSGKSYYSKQYIKQWKLKHTGSKVYLFSSLKDDVSLDDIKPTRIVISNKLVDEPLDTEMFQDSLVIFDDIDVIKDKDIKEAVYNVLNGILEIGRHFNIDCILTNHLPSNGRDTRRILNECHSITYFPHAGGGRGTRYFLENYAGLDIKEMKKIKKMKTRWATIFKTYPMCIMTEKDLFTFDDLEESKIK